MKGRMKITPRILQSGMISDPILDMVRQVVEIQMIRAVEIGFFIYLKISVTLGPPNFKILKGSKFRYTQCYATITREQWDSFIFGNSDAHGPFCIFGCRLEGGVRVPI